MEKKKMFEIYDNCRVQIYYPIHTKQINGPSKKKKESFLLRTHGLHALYIH